MAQPVANMGPLENDDGGPRARNSRPSIKKIVYRGINDVQGRSTISQVYQTMQERGRPQFSPETEVMLADWKEMTSKRGAKNIERSDAPPSGFSVDTMSDEQLERISIQLQSGGAPSPRAADAVLDTESTFEKYKHHQFVQRWGVFDDSDGIDEAWFIANPPVLSADSPSFLCEMCRHIDFEVLFSQRGLPGNKQAETSGIQLFALARVLSSTQCAFCTLLRRKIEQDNILEGVQLDYIENGSIQLNVLDDGHDYALRLEVELPDLEVELHPRFVLQAHGADTPLKGLPLGPDADLSRLRSWLDRQDKSPTIQSSDSSLGHLRLIDTKENCVREVDLPCEYVCLSYVWGQGSQIKLTVATKTAIESPGGLAKMSSQMPQTIADSMEVTKAIGLRYLWVDALCIIQDDDEDKMNIISRMGSIYGDSTLTIVASAGMDPTEGLPGIGAARRGPLTASLQGMTLAVASHDNRMPLTDIINSKWNSRAWTYQEMELSPRMVYFTNSQMIFKCEKYTAFEDTVPVTDVAYAPTPVNDQTQFDSRIYDLWMRVWADPTQREYGNKAFAFEGLTTIVMSEDPDAPDETCQDDAPIYIFHNAVENTEGDTLWDAYRRAVTAYTKRQMSHSSDAVNAFTGMADLLRGGSNTTYWHGMPSFAFTHALLWQPREVMKRRTKEGESLFPSWAWAAWEGAVSYRGRGWYNAVKFPSACAVQWHETQDRAILIERVKKMDAEPGAIKKILKQISEAEEILNEVHNARLFHYDWEEKGWVHQRDEERSRHSYTHEAYPGLNFSRPIDLPGEEIMRLPTDNDTLFFKTKNLPARFCDTPGANPVKPLQDTFFQIGLNDEKRSANYRRPWQRIVYHQGYRAGFLTLNVDFDDIDTEEEYTLAVISRDSLATISSPSNHMDFFWTMTPQEIQRNLLHEEREGGGSTRQFTEDVEASVDSENENGDPKWDVGRFGDPVVMDVFNVLLLKNTGNLSERIGVGKVSSCAFHCAKPGREMVRLV